MLKRLHDNSAAQMVLGLLLGIAFGFLLQKGGATYYDVMVGQLLWQDFTVVKIMLSAIITGMIGIYALKSLGLVELHPKAGSVGMTVIGGLIFGAGLGVLGYCPGTIAGAAGQVELDAVVGGVLGMLAGAGLFAAIYPRLQSGLLEWGDFGDVTFPKLLGVNHWPVVIPVAALLMGLLVWIERAGF
jgi:hypothetical protein